MLRHVHNGLIKFVSFSHRYIFITSRVQQKTLIFIESYFGLRHVLKVKIYILDLVVYKTRGLEALTRMLFSGHRLVCVRRVRPGNEINENGEWFFCKGKKKP